jgi:hypothetical protein
MLKRAASQSIYTHRVNRVLKLPRTSPLDRAWRRMPRDKRRTKVLLPTPKMKTRKRRPKETVFWTSVEWWRKKKRRQLPKRVLDRD